MVRGGLHPFVVRYFQAEADRPVLRYRTGDGAWQNVPDVVVQAALPAAVERVHSH